MSVYVDELRTHPAEAIQPNARRYGRRWCHMTADTVDELHAMADLIGHKRSWFQAGRWPHYDLVPSRRSMAIKHGAVEVGSLARMRQMMKEASNAN